ncbi:MAG: hypothetical protein PWP24_1239 [Clostridiales bacterium]|nr:hypothetical protein [Clostridiales bacterium]
MLTSADFSSILSYILSLLRKKKTFTLALLSSQLKETLLTPEYSYLLKEGVGLIISPSTCDPNAVSLFIEEPLFIKAFEEYFNELLAQTAPIWKERRALISYLEQELQQVKKEPQDF